jgi:hypothetical protein
MGSNSPKTSSVTIPSNGTSSLVSKTTGDVLSDSHKKSFSLIPQAETEVMRIRRPVTDLMQETYL